MTTTMMNLDPAPPTQSLTSHTAIVASTSVAHGSNSNFQHSLTYPAQGAPVPTKRENDAAKLLRLKTELMQGSLHPYTTEPNPEALEALSLRHNPPKPPTSSNDLLTPSESAISSVSERARPGASERLLQASAPGLATQTVGGVGSSLTVQLPARLASTPITEKASPQSSKDAKTHPDPTPTVIPSNATPNGVTNGNRPHTPAALTVTNGRHDLPTPQSLTSSSLPGTNHSTPGSSSIREQVKPDAFDNEPTSPSTRAPKVEPATSGAHKIPPRPNPGGPLGSSIPLPTAPREMIMRAARASTRPEPILLKRSEVQAMEREKEKEKEKERLANEEREAKRKESTESSPIRSSKDASSVQVKSEPDTDRRRGVEHDVYIPHRSTSPKPRPGPLDSSSLTADGRPRGVQHDIYVPSRSLSPPPVPAGPRDVERPKGVQHDVYVPPSSPARERDLRAPRPSESSRYERAGGSDTYRPNDDRERERDRDRDRDRRLDPVDSRRSDSGDARRADYRDDDRDRRRDRYDDPRDRGRSDSRGYPASRDPIDSKLPDIRPRVPSPAPVARRSLVDRLDSHDFRPSAADTYRPNEPYDSRDARPVERDPPRVRRESAYAPPSPPRRPPSPARSLRRDSDYRAPATFSSPRSYEAPRDWSRDDLAYERRAGWADDDRQAPSRPAADRDRDYGRDRVAPEPPRRDRDDYDRRTSSYSASAAPPARTEPRDWPPAPAPPSTDYHRALDASKQATYASSTYSASDRYIAPTPATTSRVRPRSPSPPPASPAVRPASTTTTTTAFIPAVRPSHPESEVARNAKRMRLLEQQSTSPVSARQVSPVASTITPPISAPQPAPHVPRQAPEYHPPSRDAVVYDDRSRDRDRDTRDRDRDRDRSRDRREPPRRVGSPMRDVRSEYPPTRPRSPPSGPAYRGASTYSRAPSPGRYSTWDRDRDTRDSRDSRDTRYSQRM